MSDTINELAERVAIAAVVKERGPTGENFRAEFRQNFQARLEKKETRFPIYVALETALPEVFGEEIATGTAFNLTQIRTETERSPIANEWRTAIDEAAAQAVYEHFRAAEQLFAKGQPLPATECLTNAITCSIAAIAARKGWPHSSDADIANAVTLLAAGKMPDETTDLYELMQSASEQGQDLLSAFVAVMGQPDSVRFGLFYNSADGSDEDARRFAEDTVELANRIAGKIS